jgi:hypothetical protein
MRSVLSAPCIADGRRSPSALASFDGSRRKGKHGTRVEAFSGERSLGRPLVAAENKDLHCERARPQGPVHHTERVGVLDKTGNPRVLEKLAHKFCRRGVFGYRDLQQRLAASIAPG